MPLTPETGALLVGGVMLALLVTLAMLVWRVRRRRAAPLPRSAEPLAAAAPAAMPAPLPAADVENLRAAVGEAEAQGEHKRLPGLYLSLARWHLVAGEPAPAAELLRKSIVGATRAGLKDTHATARLELGDIAHAGGDLATACEHWQIARTLFLELRRGGEHAEVEARMRRNGCPTDWVLTDF